MAFIRQIEPADAEGVLKGVYDAGAARAGTVANIIKVMGLDVRSLQASMKLYVDLMKSPNALSPARRELIAAVVSNINDCYY